MGKTKLSLLVPSIVLGSILGTIGIVSCVQFVCADAIRRADDSIAQEVRQPQKPVPPRMQSIRNGRHWISLPMVAAGSSQNKSAKMKDPEGFSYSFRLNGHNFVITGLAGKSFLRIDEDELRMARAGGEISVELKDDLHISILNGARDFTFWNAEQEVTISQLPNNTPAIAGAKPFLIGKRMGTVSSSGHEAGDENLWDFNYRFTVGGSTFGILSSVEKESIKFPPQIFIDIVGSIHGREAKVR